MNLVSPRGEVKDIAQIVTYTINRNTPCLMTSHLNFHFFFSFFRWKTILTHTDSIVCIIYCWR